MFDTTTVLDFAADGSVQGMHRESLFDMAVLGARSITRASDIRFNETSQRWDIWLANGADFDPPIAQATQFDGYEEARSAEVHWLESARLAGVNPSSPEAVTALLECRLTTFLSRRDMRAT